MSPTPRFDRYLDAGEDVLYVCRRHPAALERPLVYWVGALALLLVAVLPAAALSVVPLAVTVFVGTNLLTGYRLLRWWMTYYVVTNQRVLLIEGVLDRKVTALPLRLVIDTTYSRTLLGRLLGYGELELNLSGQPALRKLTMLPNPDAMYRLIVRLSSGGHVDPLVEAE